MYAKFILVLSIFEVTTSQFTNTRILEPPVPQLCSQRIVHERTPDALVLPYHEPSDDIKLYARTQKQVNKLIETASNFFFDIHMEFGLEKCKTLNIQKGKVVNGDVQLPNGNAIHAMEDGKGYFFSWREPTTKGIEQDWLGARNYCRKRCMDLVSLETSAENEWIKRHLVDEKVKYIWTSGRLCDFKGCERPDLQPNNINGWFWTAVLQKLAPTTQRDQNDWSETGGIGRPQPDNREAQQGGAAENCVAVLNNFYNDGVNWHDVACHHVKPWVCEENEDLLKYVRYTNPTLVV